MDHCQKLVDVLVDELQMPEKLLHAPVRTVDAVYEHAVEGLAYHDTTVRIIGGLVERELVWQGCADGDPLEERPADDPIIVHLAQISHALNLGVLSWCRRFGHFAHLTCGQLAGTGAIHGGHDMPGMRPSVFLWCGEDALASLQFGGHQDSLLTGASSSSQPYGGWPTSVSGSLGESPAFVTDLSLTDYGRLAGFRTEERAARSGTRALRALLRGGQGAAGQYVQGKYAAPQSRPSTSSQR